MVGLSLPCYSIHAPAFSHTHTHIHAHHIYKRLHNTVAVFRAFIFYRFSTKSERSCSLGCTVRVLLKPRERGSAAGLRFPCGFVAH